MSKSKKNKTEIDPEELLKDAESLFDFVNKFETLDFEKANLDKLQREIDDIADVFKEKYKDAIEESDLSEEDLDPKK